jgi:pilus assembly protein CpaC
MVRELSTIASVLILGAALAAAPSTAKEHSPRGLATFGKIEIAADQPPPPKAAPRKRVVIEGDETAPIPRPPRRPAFDAIRGAQETGTPSKAATAGAPMGPLTDDVTPIESERAKGDEPKKAAKAPRIRVLTLDSRTAGLLEGSAIPAERIAVAVNKSAPLMLKGPVRDIVIGNPEVADIVVRASDRVYVLGKTVGETNIFLLGAGGRFVSRIDVSVGLDVDSVRDMLSRLMPDDRIEVNAVGDSLVLSGAVRSDGAAARARDIARRYVKKDENVVVMLQTRTEQQVLIQVRVAEVQKSVLKELGLTHTLGNTKFIGGDARISGSVSKIGLGTEIAATINLSNILDNLSSTFTLLETQGLVRNLAEPNLLAVSGESASMLAGGEYPVPVPDQDGIKIEYKPFGIGLSFLPVVLDNGRISLKLSTEVSSLSSTNQVEIGLSGGGSVTVQSFIVRRASSTIELPSGGSIMIAGLLQNDVVSSLNGVPGVMDLPILGALFRSSSFQRSESELVVLVSALLVKPTDSKGLSLPTDGFVVSSDLDRYLIGRLQDIYVRRPIDRRAAPGPQGPIGYIID